MSFVKSIIRFWENPKEEEKTEIPEEKDIVIDAKTKAISLLTSSSDEGSDSEDVIIRNYVNNNLYSTRIHKELDVELETKTNPFRADDLDVDKLPLRESTEDAEDADADADAEDADAEEDMPDLISNTEEDMPDLISDSSDLVSDSIESDTESLDECYENECGAIVEEPEYVYEVCDESEASVSESLTEDECDMESETDTSDWSTSTEVSESEEYSDLPDLEAISNCETPIPPPRPNTPIMYKCPAKILIPPPSLTTPSLALNTTLPVETILQSLKVNPSIMSENVIQTTVDPQTNNVYNESPVSQLTSISEKQELTNNIYHEMYDFAYDTTSQIPYIPYDEYIKTLPETNVSSYQEELSATLRALDLPFPDDFTMSPIPSPPPPPPLPQVKTQQLSSVYEYSEGKWERINGNYFIMEGSMWWKGQSGHPDLPIGSSDCFEWDEELNGYVVIQDEEDIISVSDHEQEYVLLEESEDPLDKYDPDQCYGDKEPYWNGKEQGYQEGFEKGLFDSLKSNITEGEDVIQEIVVPCVKTDMYNDFIEGYTMGYMIGYKDGSNFDVSYYDEECRPLLEKVDEDTCSTEDVNETHLDWDQVHKEENPSSDMDHTEGDDESK